MRKSAIFTFMTFIFSGTAAGAVTPQELANRLAHSLCAMSDVSRTHSVTLGEGDLAVYESSDSFAGIYDTAGMGQFGFSKQSAAVGKCTKRLKSTVRICRDGVVEKSGATLTLTAWSSC